MLLLAEGLFRLDVVVTGDTLRTVVRNFSAGELASGHLPGAGAGISLGFGEVAAYEPGRTEIGFALGTGEDRVAVGGTIGTLRPPGRGTVRVSAQLIVRRAPAP
jgi:hypothetical protein